MRLQSVMNELDEHKERILKINYSIEKESCYLAKEFGGGMIMGAITAPLEDDSIHELIDSMYIVRNLEKKKSQLLNRMERK